MISPKIAYRLFAATGHIQRKLMRRKLIKMGRIKTQLTKRTTQELYSLHGSEFTKEFDDNKKIMDGFADFPSKKIRNIVAGYATRLVRNSKVH